MDRLEELGAMLGQQAQASRRPTEVRHAPPRRDSPVLTGLLMSLGAAPVLFLVLVGAFLACEGIIKMQAESAVEEIRERVHNEQRQQEQHPPTLFDK